MKPKNGRMRKEQNVKVKSLNKNNKSQCARG